MMHTRVVTIFVLGKNDIINVIIVRATTHKCVKMF